MQSLRSHPLGPEIELSSFSGNSSQVAESTLSSPALSPRLPPLPAQLEPDDTTLQLDRWDEGPHRLRQRRKPREYELSVVDPAEEPAPVFPVTQQTTEAQHSSQALSLQQQSSSAATSVSAMSNSTGMHEADADTPSSLPDIQAATLEPLGRQQAQSQQSLLDDMFPSIKKIMPTGPSAQHHSHPAAAQPADPVHHHQVTYITLILQAAPIPLRHVLLPCTQYLIPVNVCIWLCSIQDAVAVRRMHQPAGLLSTFVTCRSKLLM